MLLGAAPPARGENLLVADRRVVKYVAIYTGDWRHCRLGTRSPTRRRIKKAFAESEGERRAPRDRCKIERARRRLNDPRGVRGYAYICVYTYVYVGVHRSGVCVRADSAAGSLDIEYRSGARRHCIA